MGSADGTQRRPEQDHPDFYDGFDDTAILSSAEDFSWTVPYTTGIGIYSPGEYQYDGFAFPSATTTPGLYDSPLENPFTPHHQIPFSQHQPLPTFAPANAHHDILFVGHALPDYIGTQNIPSPTNDSVVAVDEVSLASPNPSGSPTGRPSRERNRRAAQRCREKSKKYVDELQEQEKELSAQRKTLTAHAASLKEEVLQLKTEVLKHGECECKYINNYIKSAAKQIR